MVTFQDGEKPAVWTSAHSTKPCWTVISHDRCRWMEPAGTTQEDLWPSGALKSLAQWAAASKKASKMLLIIRNNTEKKTEFWSYVFCTLAHAHLQQQVRFWSAHLRRDMWKGQGQPRGHGGETAALQGEVRTPSFFKWGTVGEPRF